MQNSQWVFQIHFLKWLNLCLRPNILLSRNSDLYIPEWLPQHCMEGLRLWLCSRVLLPPLCLSLVTSQTVLAAHGQEVMKDEVHTPSTELSLWWTWGTHKCHTVEAVLVSISMGLSGYLWSPVSITGEHYYEHSSFISAWVKHLDDPPPKPPVWIQWSAYLLIFQSSLLLTCNVWQANTE